MIKIKQVYEPIADSDGKRVLVDRVWPRCAKREDLKLRDVAPSTELRKWFGHRADRWESICRRSRRELSDATRQTCLEELAALGQRDALTLLFAARDEAHNHAVVLARVLAKDYGCKTKA